MTELKTVRGHTCEGIAKHYEAADYLCVPRLGELGQISGCDDVNYTFILYCPYCGVLLPPPPKPECRECYLREGHEEWCSEYKEGK